MKKLVVGSILGLVLSSASVFADGGASSGGGGALVCRDDRGNVMSSHLLDLWEASEIHHMNIPLSDEPADKQLDRAIQKLALAEPEIAKEVARVAKVLFNTSQDVQGDVVLEPPRDADSNYYKRGCPLEGMMFYDGSLGALQIDRSIFSKLATQTDIAAARFHEAAYYVIREWFDSTPKDSIPARKLVGCVFSDDLKCLLGDASQQQVLDGSDQLYECKNSDFSYYILHNDSVANFLTNSGDPYSQYKGWMVMLAQIKEKHFNIPVYAYVGSDSDGSPGYSTLSNFDMHAYWKYFQAAQQGMEMYKFPKNSILSDNRLSVAEIDHVTDNQDGETLEKLTPPSCKQIR